MSTTDDASAGRHFDDGKPRLELIDPSLLFAVGEILAFGAKKYGDDNWRRGIAYRRILGSILRHLSKWSAGQDKDEESGLNHLHHSACNLAFLITYESKRERYKEFDDRAV